MSTREEALQKDLQELLNMSSRERRALLIARNVQAPGFAPSPGKLSAAELARRLDSPLYSRSNISLQTAIWNYAAIELRVLPHSELLRSGEDIEEWAELNGVELANGWPKGITWSEITKNYKSFQQDRRSSENEKDPQGTIDVSELDIETLVSTTLENISAMLRKFPHELHNEILDRIREGLEDLGSDEDEGEADDDGW